MPGRLFVVVLLIVGCLFGGCAPVVFTAGAGAGYAATQEKPRSAIEAFFDDLGKSIRQTTRRLTGSSRASRAAVPGYRGGLALRIKQSTLAPTEVYQGEQVTLTLQYVVLGAPAAGVTVRERSSLSKDGKEMTVLKDESSQKENGTWENTLSFAVPASAKPGKYMVTLQISTQGQSQSTRRTFTVRR